MIDTLVKRTVPIDIIFSQDNIVDNNHKNFNELEIWQNIPIVNLDPYMQGISYVCKGNGDINKLIEFEKMRTNQEDVDHRMLEKEIRKKSSFFGRILFSSKPVISRIERDKLILEKGNLECCIEKYKGRHWMTVLMPQKIARLWDARSILELDKEIKAQGRDSFYTPILHKKYKDEKYSRMGDKRLDFIRGFLGPIHKNLSLLDIGCNTGFYTYHFYRQGFDTYGIDVDPKHLAIAHALQSMYNIDIPLKLCAMQDFKPKSKFDLVLGMSVFWHLLGWGNYPQSITPKQLGTTLDSFVNHALFWESGKRSDEEIEIIKKYSHLKYFTHLGNTSATGIGDREFGVFTRIPATELQDLLREK